MGKLIFVVGFPRTATTRVYDDLCKWCRDCPCVFEPFNLEVIYNWVVRRVVYHDVVGDVVMRGITDDVKEVIIRNGFWVRDWRRGRGSFCGDWVGVLKKISDLGGVVIVKDVRIWPLLPAIKQVFGDDVFIISTIRDIKGVVNSFVKLYSLRCWDEGLRDKIRRIKRIYRMLVRNGIGKLPLILAGEEFFKDECGRGFLSLADFFVFYYGYSELRRLVKITGGDVETIKLIIERTYPLYRRQAEIFADFVIYFENRLSGSLYGMLFDRLGDWV